MALLISGCPSPVNGIFTGSDGSQPYETTARVIVDPAGGLVFVEEDGTETPVSAIVNGVPDGPVELIDYTVLDDSPGTGRSSSTEKLIRCVVIGRRSDGKSGIWVIYRRYGVIVVPNEDGIEDSALMELVEVNGSPWLGDDWVYDAKAISEDGLIIIGQLSRPDGWEYLTGDVPEPSIGVWWSLHYIDNKLVISRARPILLMNEPIQDTSDTRCSYRQRYREWLERLIEWIQAYFLDQAWNYLADVTEFVEYDDVEGGIPDGYYVIAGPDKHGVDAWAWITRKSVENIVDAPDDPSVNNPPWEVTGPIARQWVEQGVTFLLEVSDLSDPPNVYVSPGPFDPDGDTVSFEVIPVSIVPDHPEIPGFTPEATAENGVFSMVWHPVYDGTQHQITFMVKTSDGTDETLSDPIIRVTVY